MFTWFSRRMGHWLARFLGKPLKHFKPSVVTDVDGLKSVLKVGDVILVEGELRVSSAIKYLTQSTWSHAAMYVGTIGDQEHMLIEADMEEGVRAIPLSFYENYHLRISRPYKITAEDQQALKQYMVNRLGDQYDLDNVIDLIRYLLPNPPVPSAWRRGLLELGSGEPTKAICSTVIAQAFISIQYPILPESSKRLLVDIETRKSRYVNVFRERHFSLFVPRDFDVSPYFQIVKPSIEKDFDYEQSIWSD